MKHLVEREYYISEYFRNNVKKENTLYEGLISTLFGGIKMLFKKDWDSVKCKNPTILEYLKSIDKNLIGYTFTKMQFSSECNNIRQNVADYFNDILDYKLLQIKKEENINKFIEQENLENEDEIENIDINKYLNLKDNTLLDSLKKYKENISSVCKQNRRLREYADQLLNSVVVFVNDIIIKELEQKDIDKSKLDEKKKKLKEEREKFKEIRNKMNELAKKASEDELKKLSDERDSNMRDIEVKPIGAMSGDKSIDMIVKQFGNMLGEFKIKLNESELPKVYSEIFRSDTHIGIKKSLEKVDWNFSENDGNDTPEGIYDKFLIKVILNKINTVYKVVLKNKDMFKDVPSASVQAMMISLSNVIIYGFIGDRFDIKNDTPRLSLLTKCVIDSDATIGFNLPLIDPQKPDNGNFFVSIMNQFKNADINSKEVENAVNSMQKEDVEKIIQEWIGDKESSEESEENTDNPKNNVKFIKQFGPKLMKDFRQNIKELFDIIVKKAKDIKEESEKNRNKK